MDIIMNYCYELLTIITIIIHFYYCLSIIMNISPTALNRFMFNATYTIIAQRDVKNSLNSKIIIIIHAVIILFYL